MSESDQSWFRIQIYIHQLLVVRDPGDEVRQLVVVDGPRLNEFLEELICSPEHQ